MKTIEETIHTSAKYPALIITGKVFDFGIEELREC